MTPNADPIVVLGSGLASAAGLASERGDGGGLVRGVVLAGRQTARRAEQVQRIAV